VFDQLAGRARQKLLDHTIFDVGLARSAGIAPNLDAYGGYSHLATSDRRGGDSLKLAFCWAHGRRKLIKATTKSGSPIVDEALVRIAALYKIEDSIRDCDLEHRRAV